MDFNAAGLLRAENGAEKVRAVSRWRDADAFSEVERIVLAYAEAMTDTSQELDDELFERARSHFSDAQLVSLSAWICLENFYSKFNRSFRIAAQGFCMIG